MRELCNRPGIWERKSWGNRRDKPLSCLYWERDERKRGISVCTVLLKHGDQMLPKLSKAFLYALLINYYCFEGHSLRSKRCFTKIQGFQAFIPFPLEKVWKSAMHFDWTLCKISAICTRVCEELQRKTWTNLHLTVYGLQPLPAPFLFAWGFVEQRGPSRLEKGRDIKDRYKNHSCWPTSVKQIDCTHYTGSHFKTLLNQVAVGWIPLNSLRSYCLLWSIALNPRRSSCGYQTHLFYEDLSVHNRLEVIENSEARSLTNLHLFHQCTTKESTTILPSFAFFPKSLDNSFPVFSV